MRALVAKQAATLEEKIRALASKEVGYDDQARTLANKDAEISSRDAIIADRDRQITDLRSQLSEAQARVQLSNANSMSLSPVTFDASTFTEESPVGAISMLNMPMVLWLHSSNRLKMLVFWVSKKAAKLSNTNSKMLSTKRVTMVIVMR